MLNHGGNLRQAALQYGIPLTQWLDLSTGINPRGWPVPNIPPDSWQRLPEVEDGLETAARAYYQAEHLLPVAGSQAAIQVLPRLRPVGTVGMLAPTYAEHEFNWARYGHTVTAVRGDDIDTQLPALDVLLLVNPNNPTGQRWPTAQLLEWHRRLSTRGGWLVVDEAFMDGTPQESLAPFAHRPGLVVLRSLGKFFGLAGARCGFVLAEFGLLDALRDWLGPWSVSGPTRVVARLALTDNSWHITHRKLLKEQSERLACLLTDTDLTPDGGTPFFQWLQHTEALVLHQTLAQQGIWTRYFAEPASLRFGLPATETQWRRLQQALKKNISR